MKKIFFLVFLLSSCTSTNYKKNDIINDIDIYSDLTYEEFSDAKKSIGVIISSTFPNLPRGIFLHIFVYSFLFFSTGKLISVRKGPGEIEFTVILSLHHSRAKLLVNINKAALLAVYEVLFSIVLVEKILVKFITLA